MWKEVIVIPLVTSWFFNIQQDVPVYLVFSGSAFNLSKYLDPTDLYHLS